MCFKRQIYVSNLPFDGPLLGEAYLSESVSRRAGRRASGDPCSFGVELAILSG